MGLLGNGLMLTRMKGLLMLAPVYSWKIVYLDLGDVDPNLSLTLVLPRFIQDIYHSLLTPRTPYKGRLTSLCTLSGHLLVPPFATSLSFPSPCPNND